MALSGNKGEWSEAYVFMWIAAHGVLYACDSELNRLPDDSFLPVKRIIREETKNQPFSFHVAKDGVAIEDADGNIRETVPFEEFSSHAQELLDEIVEAKGSRSFAFPLTEEFLDSVYVTKLKAPSSDKTDITLEVHDPQTGTDLVKGWSVKSELGNPPTLLNAGKTTNFVYEIIDFDASDIEEVNEIDQGNKIIKRVEKIEELGGSLEFSHAASPIFERNMRLVDSFFPAIMAEALKLFYLGRASKCAEIVELLEEEDPLSLGSGMYEYKFKKFLASSALSMKPATEWDGRDDATGGYIIVTKTGDVVAFHIYNRDQFEDYLLQNTRFEKASTSRHGFAEAYVDNNVPFFNLNLQIRFI